jgi:methionyl-tRNA formyltransferase
VTVSSRIVFMGSPDFAVPCLEALAGSYPVVGVVTQPDRPAGRGGSLRPPAVKEAALRLGLPVIQPEKLRQPEALEQLARWAPDVIVVAAFGQILRPNVLDLPRYGCVNVHGSLLPRWRGAAPLQAAILAGDRETGITIMKMDPGVDTGPILSQRALPIAADETGGSLFVRMAQLGADLLLETLPRYLAGELGPRPQPEQGATYAPMLKKEDGLLDLTRPAVELERRVRAMHPWPGAYFVWQGQPVKVLRAVLREQASPGAGRRLVVDGLPALGTGEGLLLLQEVQPAGKKPMPGKAFLAGARDWA